jgi:NADH:ubiquinone oxidoreductase, NDUFS5-15kDa
VAAYPIPTPPSIEPEVGSAVLLFIALAPGPDQRAGFAMGIEQAADIETFKEPRGNPQLHFRPLLRSPFTDYFSRITTLQLTHCADFEMNYWRCQEAYGYHLGRRYCDLEYRDMMECMHSQKQVGAVARCRLAHGSPRRGTTRIPLPKRRMLIAPPSHLQMNRFSKIQKERWRQFLKGEKDRPHSEAPGIDACQPDYYHQNDL